MKHLLILAMAAVFLSSCGDEKSQAYQEGTDLCSATFIADYNATNSAARSALLSFDRPTIEKARDGAVAFKNKYLGVNCRASVKRMGATTASGQMVDASADADTMINALNAFLP